MVPFTEIWPASSVAPSRVGIDCFCQLASKLIGRDWYELSDWNLTDDGKCLNCGQECKGVFDGPAGEWGAKRQVVNIGNFV